LTRCSNESFGAKAEIRAGSGKIGRTPPPAVQDRIRGGLRRRACLLGLWTRATCIAVLVRLSFAAMASSALAQDPLPIPGNLGATYSMPIEPARTHLHSPPHHYRRCTKWYIAQAGPAQYLRVPFPDECPGGRLDIAAKGLGPWPRPLVVVPVVLACSIGGSVPVKADLILFACAAAPAA
jgi:hypothetical protein